jgi:hypothetical protein
MYGPLPPASKPSAAINQEANEIGHSNSDTTVMASQSRRPSLIASLTRILPDRLLKHDDEQGEHSTKFKKIKTLKVAFSEFYLMLILLQKYQLLNFTGFCKILKKHDKLFQTTRGNEWR